MELNTQAVQIRPTIQFGVVLKNQNRPSLVKDKPTIVMPVEITARELHAKVVLAIHLAQKNVRVVIAKRQKALSIALDSKKITWYGKFIFKTKDPFYFSKRFSEGGSKMVLTSEEGGMHQENHWSEKIFEKYDVAKYFDLRSNYACVWGTRQKQVLEQKENFKEVEIVSLGNERFDLCREKYSGLNLNQVADLKDKYGNFILVTTRFSSINNAEGAGHIFDRRLDPKRRPTGFTPGEVENIWFSKWRQDVHDFSEYVVTIKELASHFTRTNFIIRPHPAEDQTFYSKAFRHFKNVIVDGNGSFLTWSRACGLLIHSNCTTGVEAVLSNCSTINFKPDIGDRLNVSIANEAGLPASSVAECADGVQHFFSGGKYDTKWSSDAKSMLLNLDYETCPMISNYLLNITDGRESHLVLPGRKLNKYLHRFQAKEGRFFIPVRSEIENILSSYDPRVSLNAFHDDLFVME